MKTLVINAGSSSLKYQLINMENEAVLAKGAVERIGIEGSFLKHKWNDSEVKIEQPLKDHSQAIELVLKTLTNKETGVLTSIDEIDAIGHRVVHGGEDYTGSVLITPEVLRVIESNASLAPLHVPANVMGIKACKEVAPNLPNVAVFDTAFHANMPDYAYRYALPKKTYTDFKVRRYGFHGTSHFYVANRMAQLMNKDIKDLKIITCHLGNGSSIAAVKNGVSVDTTMGFTPLEGLMMGTRSGDLDPAVHEYLMEKLNLSINELTSYLNKKSGLLGVSGISSDMRDLEDARETVEDAKLAMDMLAYRVKKYIGSYTAVMNGVDAIVFTAGVGEYTPDVRREAVINLEYFGIELDENKNENAPRGKEFEISKNTSKVKVFIIPTNEELVIGRQTKEIVENL